MELAEYEQMHKQEQNYWWHIGRREILRRVLAKWLSPQDNKQVLDIGCGTGINYWWLKEWGEVTGVDSSPEALNYCRQQQAYDALVQIDGTNLELPDKFDLAVAFDVLEHITEDETALKSWWQAIKLGGYLMITVPAYQWLWSAHDQALHHYRRYSVGELKTKFRKAGFTIQFISPFFFFTFPVVVLVRLFTKGTKPKTSYIATTSRMDKVLINLSRIEADYLVDGGHFPWGSSILVIARKG